MALPFWLLKACVRTGLARHLPMAARLTGGEPAFARHVSDRVLAAPLGELLDPATSPQPSGPDVMNLNMGAPAPEAMPSLRPPRDSGPTDAFGLPELRAAISESHAREGRPVGAGQILVTHGATGAFAAVLDAFVNPGDRVVLFDPCSPLFHLGARSRRARLRWVPTWSEDGRTRFLSAGLTRAMRGAKLLVLAQPCNPTGGRFSTADLEEIAWLAGRHDVLVCLDGSAGRFHYDTAPPPCLADFPGMATRMLGLGSLAVGYGLGDLRVGWLSGHRQLVRTAALCANLSAPGVSPIMQSAVATVLKRDRAGFAPTLGQFRERRQYAFDRLKGMGLEPTWPAGGFTMWVSVASLGTDGRAFAERLLREHRTLVGPGCAYGPSGTDFVRVSYAVEEGRLREGLSRLACFVSELKNPEGAGTAEPPMAEKSGAVEAAMPSFSRA